MELILPFGMIFGVMMGLASIGFVIGLLIDFIPRAWKFLIWPWRDYR